MKTTKIRNALDVAATQSSEALPAAMYRHLSKKARPPKPGCESTLLTLYRKLRSDEQLALLICAERLAIHRIRDREASKRNG